MRKSNVRLDLTPNLQMTSYRACTMPVLPVYTLGPFHIFGTDKTRRLKFGAPTVHGMY